MDSTTNVILITLSLNLAYQLVHYCIRKLSECQEVDFFCFKFSKNEISIRNKRSSESDKDGITEISIK